MRRGSRGEGCSYGRSNQVDHDCRRRDRWLLTDFPDSDYADPLRDRYNKLTGKLYDEVRDFICLHYALSNRTDSQYWMDVREELDVPDSLAENIELWRHNLPGSNDLEFGSLFFYGTYQAVLMGKRVYETGFGSPAVNKKCELRKDVWAGYLQKVRGNVHRMVHEWLITTP